MTILVITGPSGSGKTQIAQHLAWMFNDADQVVVLDDTKALKKPRKIPERLIVTCQQVPEWVKETGDYIMLQAPQVEVTSPHYFLLENYPPKIRDCYDEIPAGIPLSTQEIEAISLRHGLNRGATFRLLKEGRLFERIRNGVYQKR